MRLFPNQQEEQGTPSGGRVTAITTEIRNTVSRDQRMPCLKQSSGMGMANAEWWGGSLLQSPPRIPSRGSFAGSSSTIDYLMGPALPLTNLAILNCPPASLWLSRGTGRGKLNYKGRDSSVILSTAFPGLLRWARYCAGRQRSPAMNRGSHVVSGSLGHSPGNEPRQPQ